MPAVAETLRVEGLRDLQRAFAVADREVARQFRDALKDAADPVRRDSEELARFTIPRIGIPWSTMRIGVTRTSVYVAPARRATRNRALRRPNLAGLLLDRAMLPALARNQSQIVRRVENMLDDVARKWAHVG